MRETSGAHAHVEMSLRTVGVKGVDQLKQSFDDEATPGDELTYSCVGVRTLLWQVRVRSWRSAAALDAVYYIDRLRMYLRAPRSDTLLRGASLGVETVNQSQDLGAYMVERRESVQQVDIMLCAGINDAIHTDTYIETVYGESLWRDSNGALLPDAYQIDGELT